MTVQPFTDGFRRVTVCRVCGSPDLAGVVSLGSTPLANSFISPARVAEPEPSYPLAAVRCTGCHLVQLSVVVDPTLMFSDYLYSSSASTPTVTHFEAVAEDLVSRFGLAGKLVVEVGSNDGILLKPLRERGALAVGVEPAGNLAAVANARGLETRSEFFGAETAGRLAAEKGRAGAVLANNVLAHIDDLHGVVRGLDALLADDGFFAAEVPYLQDLLDRVEYDTIYHEHLSYFALAPLVTLARGAGLEVFDVQRIPVHGGSIRVFIGRPGRHQRTGRLDELERAERANGLLGDTIYRRFAQRVEESRTAIRAMLHELRAGGKRIAGLGASAKGNTLLNYCGIGPDILDFIGDSTTYKQGLLTPGTHIPVRAETAIREARPDHTLLLAWNYADAIVPRYADYRAAGGRFIHPIPLARIIE